MPELSFDDQQVNEILARAGQLEADAAGQLDKTSLETLEASALEAGIDPAHVRQAVSQMETEWRLRRVRERQRQETRRKLGIGAVVVIVLFLGGGLMKRSSRASFHQAQVQQLTTLKAQVEAAEAQVRNVTERRDHLKAAGNLNAPGMRDELVGAENRIAAERKKLTDAVTAYNLVAQSMNDRNWPVMPLP